MTKTLHESTAMGNREDEGRKHLCGGVENETMPGAGRRVASAARPLTPERKKPDLQQWGQRILQFDNKPLGGKLLVLLLNRLLCFLDDASQFVQPHGQQNTL